MNLLEKLIHGSQKGTLNVILTGTSNNDNLIGIAENDTLSGLRGNDYLDGKGGADTYLFNRGDGQDTLYDSSTDNSVDQLIFSGTGLTSTNVIVTRIGTTNDLKISFGGGISDSIVLKNQVYSTSSNYGVESVKFSDGATWTEEKLWNAYLTTGASSNDTLEGTNLGNTIKGGLGNDYLDGKGGADTYLFNLGDGQDTLYDSSTDNSVDQLIFSGTGLTSANAIVTRIGTTNDLKISFGGGISDSIVLKNQVYSTSSNYGVESVKFSDGVTWTEEKLWNAYLTTGASSNDTLEGTNLSNTIRGGVGTDYLDGKGGVDTYLFNLGDGQDTLYDSSTDTSVDQLIFSGTGLTSTNAIVTRIGTTNDLKISFGGGISDSIVLKNQVYSTSSNYGVESVKFSDGATWTEERLWNAYLTTGASSNDTLEGTNLSNTIRGGVGTDYLDGKGGADTYLFNLGDGQDTLYDSSTDNSVDQLIFSGTGLTSANAIVTRIGTTNDLKISFGGGISDSIVLKNQVYSTSSNYGVESVKFSDGVTWTEEKLWNAYLTTGASSNDTLEGTNLNNTIRGGIGTDYLDGKGGADTYLFNLGDGQDTLYDSSTDTSVDQLIFSGTGLTSANAIVTRIGTTKDLKISFGGGISDSVVLKNQLYSASSNYGVESVKFSDGVTWTEERLWNANLKAAAASNDSSVSKNLNNPTSIDQPISSGTTLISTNTVVNRLDSNDLKISLNSGISDSSVLK